MSVHDVTVCLGTKKNVIGTMPMSLQLSQVLKLQNFGREWRVQRISVEVPAGNSKIRLSSKRDSIEFSQTLWTGALTELEDFAEEPALKGKAR